MPDAAAGRELPDDTALRDGTVSSSSGGVDEAAALDLLSCGTLEVKGRLVDASNATMYCMISADGTEAACVYKPVAGERPLWDFPEGTLAGRELAAYLVSRAAGWDVVPPTVYRDGPFGPGMCQLWIDADTSVDLLELARSNDERLRQMAVFDAVVNNADRKIGHLLPDVSGHLYGCDHGVCFGEDYKLRTVLWQWRGKKLPASAMAALGRLRHQLTHGGLRDQLTGWLSGAELDATARRIELLIQHKAHPFPPSDWPAVPWPPI
ncbi:MAG: SCO1664 family protein [Streptosporangiaceae bacterium]